MIGRLFSRIERNDHDRLVAEPAPGTGTDGDRLADFFASDIQNSEAWAAELITILDDIIEGVRSAWDRFGNAYLLEADAERVTIACHWGTEGETSSFDVKAVRDAANCWQRKLQEAAS